MDKAIARTSTVAAFMTLLALAAYHFARIWSWLQGDVNVHGLVMKMPGSFLLVMTFANIIILAFNLNAYNTAYQSKMEQVFSAMGELELPHPIRERVHQYYEYLHVEYESLDGEVIKFAKDLSHTLELEVVLFKYMDVLMQVPHWRGCSPDFQKQLVLSLNVRIYLPDDFIMRRGEVGTECYLINRGTCKLYEYPTGNYEPPTEITMADNDSKQSHVPNRRGSSVAWSMGSHAVTDTEAEEVETGRFKRIGILKRGQAIGEFALLANYERSSDLRAVSFVQMCVTERESFQQLLTRYARDREIVVRSIVRHRMLSIEGQGLPCPLMDTVRQIAPNASVEEAAEYVTHAINVPRDDPSIIFGMSSQLLGRLQEEFVTSQSDDAIHATHQVRPSVDADTSVVASTPDGSAHDANLVFTVRELQARLRRLEELQRQPPRVHLLPRRRRRINPNLAAYSWSVVTQRRVRAHRYRWCLER